LLRFARHAGYSSAVARLPLDELTERIHLLLQEMTMTGRWLLPSLRRPMEAVKSGRSPRALDLAAQLTEPEEWLRVLAEVFSETTRLLPDLRSYYAEHHAKNPNSPDIQQLGKWLSSLEGESAFWQGILDRARALLKKLRLISEEEKLSPLARGPLQDAWDELAQLAR
jgi:hypothetical protein